MDIALLVTVIALVREDYVNRAKWPLAVALVLLMLPEGVGLGHVDAAAMKGVITGWSNLARSPATIGLLVLFAWFVSAPAGGPREEPPRAHHR